MNQGVAALLGAAGAPHNKSGVSLGIAWGIKVSLQYPLRYLKARDALRRLLGLVQKIGRSKVFFFSGPSRGDISVARSPSLALWLSQEHSLVPACGTWFLRQKHYIFCF
jgi:hypothetical protein